MYSLKELGWCPFFDQQVLAEQGTVAARVAEENRELYRILCEGGEFLAELSGRLRYRAQSQAAFPAVGDWVLAEVRGSEGRAKICRVLERQGKFSRKIAGRKTQEQIVAANVDVVFLVSSLNREFNPRRIERYLSLAWNSGARPVIVLNKSDLCEHPEAFRAEAQAAAAGASVILASAVRGDGLAELRALLQTGLTGALLGSSGVGKSSLINAILEEERLATRAVRESDDRGRHATTSRQLMVIPGGGVLIDTPGMRELQLWDAIRGVEHTFEDIQELAAGCKFRDCKHQGERGCAVRETVAAERLASYEKLLREEQFLEAKQDAALRSQRTKQLRRLMKSVNQLYRDRNR